VLPAQVAAKTRNVIVAVSSAMPGQSILPPVGCAGRLSISAHQTSAMTPIGRLM
jgi:hypothetical protein